MRRLVPAALIGVLALLAYALVGHGLVNYDSLYSLVWGRELAHGTLPAFDVPLAPTPHPLSTLAGVLASPLSSAESGGLHGQAATTTTLVLAFAALGVLGLLVYRLGAAWFGPWAGALAAAIVLTRRPVLDFGARAYVDIPYLALLLGALLAETRRPRRGAPVLVLLALAGLIRPEAWLFSAAYLAWLWHGGERDGIGRLALLAGSAPVLWLATDLVLAGDALHSLTGTRDTAERLGRVTGLQHVPTTVPRRLGEILREPVLLGAAGGLALSWAFLRERARTGIAAGLLALAAFCVLAAAGLPILGRYLLFPAALLAIFAGAGAFGWQALAPGHPWRRRWQAFAAVTAVALVAFAPAQADRIGDLRDALDIQHGIQADLSHLADEQPLAGCRPVTAPNHRPVPLLALWLDESPTRILSATDGPAPSRGAFLTPSSPAVAAQYVLDPRDTDRTIAAAPPGFEPAGANRSWRLLARGC